MCYTIRHCRHGHTILTTEHAPHADGPSLRKRDAFIAACPRANTQGAKRPELELEESCPVCRGEAEAEEEEEEEDEEEADDDDDDDAEEHSSMKTHACHTPGRISPHVEPTELADLYDLARGSSHESTNPDDIPALSRSSQSTWTSSIVCSLRGSTDFAASHDEDLRIRIVNSLTPMNASQQDLVQAVKAVSLGPMTAQHGGVLLSATQSALSLHPHHGDDDDDDDDGADGPGPGRETSTAPSSSVHAEAVGGEHRHRFAKLWGWKQTKSAEHKRDKVELKGTRPEKKSRSGWKAIMLRSRSVDSDRSFVCVTARELLNEELQRQGQDMEDRTWRGG
ncbi:hypothetical protein E4U17_007144 [Claviceps sp. LM77 group G4]|nr:hypothetical protein E4U17_007144 [Claviceps sp. LM77 group G4]KAG6071233.1 hypothetical protein E4U33_003818 [Claviceps sp. LM78 group G4]KAG6080264.1 hypothetical protein E4U16_000478 [Claviceps sp. LM84 group G4]